MTEIPIIDFSEMDIAVSRKLDTAFREIGFAIVTNVYNQYANKFITGKHNSCFKAHRYPERP